jgi:hypothetical protein
VKQGNKKLAKLEDRSTPMVSVGYESGSKACRFYNPGTKCVHVLYDAVFKEDRPWRWSSDEQGSLVGDDPFKVEYISVRNARAEPVDEPGSALATPNRVSSEHGGEASGSVTEPGTPLSPTSPDTVEFVSPPEATPDLDINADDAPCQFHTMRNILGIAPVPRIANKIIVEDLLAAIGEQPCLADEALKVKE